MRISGYILLVAGAGMLGSTAVLAQLDSGRRSAPTSENAMTRDLEKGLKALQEGRYTDARQAFDQVLLTAPDDASINYYAGLSTGGMNDHKNARRYYERALRANKNHVGASMELGRTHLKLGDRPKAEAQLAKLKAQQEKCKSACKEAADLARAVEVLTSALANPA